MEFKIFDYTNKIKWCSIPEDEKPCAIIVAVISGDESVTVFTDADKLYHFESSNTRFADYRNGAYILRDTEDIINWCNWKPDWGNEDAIYSYLRRDNFRNCTI